MLTRSVPLVPEQSALLLIDVQNFNVRPEGGSYRGLDEEQREKRFATFFQTLNDTAIPNMQALLTAFRNMKIEVLFTTIESLTLDGRDRSLDYKITGFNVPKGSWDGKVIDELAPLEDEIWLPKNSASVFVSTHIDYILRNLGVRQIVIAGLLTDQCVESAIRDACDLGYLVTQVTDACATHTETRQQNSIEAIRGFCRQVTTRELLDELG